MTLPNFLIVGVARSGTTSLYNYLKQHPEVYMSPIKEPKYFAFQGEQLQWAGPNDQKSVKNYIATLEEYQNLFKNVAHEKAIGEISPWYLYSKTAASRIKSCIPDVKLIVILRNPIDRAYSNFLVNLKTGRESLDDFEKVIKQENQRIQQNWGWTFHYITRGFYYENLMRYFNLFEPHQIKIYIYEDLTSSPENLLYNLCQYLEVDDNFIFKTQKKHNISYIPKSRLLEELLNNFSIEKSRLVQGKVSKNIAENLKQTLKQWNQKKTKMSPKIRDYLIDVYKEDIMKVQDLINRDLSSWLS